MKEAPSDRPAQSGPSGLGMARTILLAIAGWLIPGGGHMVAGKFKWGGFYLIMLAGTFMTGIAMTDLNTVAPLDHPYYFMMQLGAGVIPIATWCLRQAQTPALSISPYTDMGFLFTSVAGLLNILVIFHAYDQRKGTVQAISDESASGMEHEKRHDA